MRIIAGAWRGRKLEVPPGIRPMQDRERERLFSILGDHVTDAALLDVFAGSGALSLEALSRGARLATLVENGRKVLPVLKRNLEALGAGPQARLLPISAFGLAKSGEPGQGAVDIAVCTPPFPLLADAALRDRFRTLFLYVARNLAAPGATFVLEHPPRLDPAGATGLGPPRDTRHTAGSAVSLWDIPAAASEQS
jgi:16S rRNA (guanine966-N2)-methyltransferase